MKCIFCGEKSTRVINSRTTTSGKISRRRRSCTACKGRFTTYEKPSFEHIIVCAKNGAKEIFSEIKLYESITKEDHQSDPEAIHQKITRVKKYFMLKGKNNIRKDEIRQLLDKMSNLHSKITGQSYNGSNRKR